MSFSLFAPINSSQLPLFDYPFGLAFDSSGYLYCSNNASSSIIKISPDATTVTTFCLDPSLSSPVGIAFDSSGYLYCPSSGYNIILKISPDGTTVTTFSSDASLNGPRDIAFDTSGNLYCSCINNSSILKFSPDGTTVTTFSSDASLNSPYGLAFDASGYLYCSCISNSYILKFSPNGTKVATFSDLLIDSPAGLAFDASGNLYCCNILISNIIKINSDGTTISTFSSDTSLNNPNLLAFDSSEYLYVSNSGLNNILKTTNVVCFNENTKILCLNNLFEEVYIPIQDLKKGDFVKTYKYGFRKIEFILKGEFYNNPNYFYKSMYKMEKTDENELLEDLIITGGHSIMEDSISEEEQEKYNKLGLNNFIEENKIDDKFLVLAAVSDKFIQLKDNNKYTYYHLLIENNGDNKERYGIWANGILTETTSKEYLLQQKIINE